MGLFEYYQVRLRRRRHENINLSVTVDRQRLQIELRTPGKARWENRPGADVRPGGLGTHFMAAAFDTVSYDTSREAGTVLTLIKEKR
jgi:anti-sigma regulatory factor (Ser/Thr protein kinase)